jgi:hypothetical protein
MPALLQDAYSGVSPAVLSTWPGGVGALNVPIPLRGGYRSRKHRRRPTRKASRKVQRKSRRLTRRK